MSANSEQNTLSTGSRSSLPLKTIFTGKDAVQEKPGVQPLYVERKGNPSTVILPVTSGKQWTQLSGWLFAVLVTTFLLLNVFLPLLVGEPLRTFVMAGFSTVCHQIADRSFHVHGVSLAVCHRCTGIYLGLWLAVLVYPLIKNRVRDTGRYSGILVLAALVPAGADWISEIAGLWNNTVFSRVTTGLIFGVIAGYLLARALTRTREPGSRSRTSEKSRDWTIEGSTE